MKKELYVVEFDSVNYCGAPEHCRVWAESEDDAMDEAAQYADDFYREQDEEQYMDEHDGEDADTYGNVLSAVLQKGSKYEQWIADPVQAATFYPIVN